MSRQSEINPKKTLDEIRESNEIDEKLRSDSRSKQNWWMLDAYSDRPYVQAAITYQPPCDGNPADLSKQNPPSPVWKMATSRLSNETKQNPNRGIIPVRMEYLWLAGEVNCARARFWPARFRSNPSHNQNKKIKTSRETERDLESRLHSLVALFISSRVSAETV